MECKSKLNQVRRLQNGGVTSEEDVSLSGAQGIRCRVGSYSGGPDQHMNKEDTYSPGNYKAKYSGNPYSTKYWIRE